MKIIDLPEGEVLAIHKTNEIGEPYAEGYLFEFEDGEPILRKFTLNFKNQKYKKFKKLKGGIENGLHCKN